MALLKDMFKGNAVTGLAVGLAAIVLALDHRLCPGRRTRPIAGKTVGPAPNTMRSKVRCTRRAARRARLCSSAADAVRQPGPMLNPPTARICHLNARRMRVRIPDKRRDAAFFDDIVDRLSRWPSDPGFYSTNIGMAARHKPTEGFVTLA
jgi:hypothetical protein